MTSPASDASPSAALPDETAPERVVLRVADLAPVGQFYRFGVGLAVLERDDERVILGTDAGPIVELRADPDGTARPDDAAGLYHLAIRVPDRPALGAALERLRERWQLHGAADHLVSEALYTADPEGNGVELYRDRPREEWPRTADGGVEMDTRPLDLEALARVGTDPPAWADREFATEDSTAAVPGETDLGHVHLEVTDIDRSRAWYVDRLGLAEMARYGRDASFLAAGGYHHHVGLNVWEERTAPSSGRGLERVVLGVPDADALEALRERMGVEAVTGDDEGELRVDDPDGIRWTVRVADRARRVD